MKSKMVKITEGFLQLVKNPPHQTRTMRNNSSLISIDSIGEGGRNSTLASMLGNYSKQGFSKELAYDYAQSINEKYFDPPLEDKEVQAVVKSVYRYDNHQDYKKSYPKSYALTDVGNSQRFADMFGDKVHYVPELNNFFIYNGKYWVLTRTGEIERMARVVCKTMKDESQAIQDSDQRKALLKHANRSESERNIKAMINLLKSEEEITKSINEFDKDHMLLNCENGTIDLGSGRLMPHDQRHFITKMIKVSYDPEAKAPLFDEFLNQIFENNTQLIRYVQRAIGYSLTGSTKEQSLFILQGIGSNGKSVFIDVLRELFASYSCNADFKTFTKQNSNGPRNDIARMAQSRFVTAVEGDKDSYLDESLIKSVTGGDMVTARFLYKELFDYYPTYKIFLVTNYLPRISNSGHSIWRRIKVILFDVIIPGSEQDKDLTNKLKQELVGVLNWCVEGCIEWQKFGLQEPKEVTYAVERYRNSADNANVFLKSRCDITPLSFTRFSDIYAEYKEWCEDNCYDIVGTKEFTSKLVERGCSRYRGFPGGDRGYKGIELK